MAEKVPNGAQKVHSVSLAAYVNAAMATNYSAWVSIKKEVMNSLKEKQKYW